MTATNPFATETAWDVGDGGSILSAGDHLVKVIDLDGEGNSKNGYPQIEVKLGNDQGDIRDWIVVIPSTIGKVVQLTDAAGLERPNDTEVSLEGSGYRFTPTYLARLLGKEVGVIVREEPDRNDPSRTRTRVQGYVTRDKITTTDGTPVASFSQPQATPSAADDSIPFLWEGPTDYLDAKTHDCRPRFDR